MRHLGGRRRRHALARTRIWRGVGLLAVGCAGLFAAVATAAPAKKPPPTTTIITTNTTTTMTTTTMTTTTMTTTTTTPTTTTPTATVVATTTAPSPPPVVRTEVVQSAAPLADIAVTTLAPIASVYVGQSVTYTHVVTNSGPATATGVQLVDEPLGSFRLLASVATAGACSGEARITCALGSLASGASAVVTVTVTPTGAAPLANLTRASADQADPQADNNMGRIETAVLVGHAGAPEISVGGGAFQPPLFARAQGRTRVVSTFVALDEAAQISVSVLDASGKPVTLLPGSRVNYVPSGRPHASLPWVVTKAGRVPLRLLIAAPPALRYRIVVRAASANGEASVATIAFTT